MQAHQEELVGSNDHHHHHQAMIMKGKRTKRPRPSVTSSSSSASIGGGGGGGVGVAEEFNSVSSPTTSGLIYESTEEEEDMANCLIMLAQSDCPKRKFGEGKIKVENFSSRKFSEISTTTNKAGFFVYECKTCNRSFPSFQALGGHRASHKKAKSGAAVATDDKKPVVLSVKDVDQEHHLENPVLALQVSKNKANCHGNKGNKIHECSICGSEFSSGQALGGHMRRHRAAAAAVVAAAAVTTGSKQAGVVDSDITPKNILSLDLNLPAPEDDLRDSKFQFVFSTPALVDCPY